MCWQKNRRRSRHAPPEFLTMTGLLKAPLNLLKAPLNRLSPTTVVTILSGPLRGKKWIIGASRHAYWLGLYEKDKSKHFARHIKSGQVVYDVGAHVGYYSLLAATRVGREGHVWAFEPVPENFAFLQRHIELNRIPNITCMQTAIARSSGTTYFRMGGTRSTGKLSSQGELAVAALCLDDLVSACSAPLPNVIKLDIEGAELDALQGARNLLLASHPKLYVATHSESLHRDCIEYLAGMKYEVTVLEWDPSGHVGELFAA